jgi:hypothetical protein
MDFFRHMQAQGVAPVEVTADHVKLYKRALLMAASPFGPPRLPQIQGNAISARCQESVTVELVATDG